MNLACTNVATMEFSSSCTALLKIIKYGKNLAKNEEKPCSTCLKSISPWHFQTLKPGFRVPELSLNTYLNEILFKNSVTVRDCINKQQSLETINAFWQSANALYARVGV